MTRQQLPEQHAFSFDDKKGIPRRRSAMNRQGEYPTDLAPASAQLPTEEDEEILDEGYNPYRLPSSARRYHASQGRTYVIPMTDGSVLRVAERELTTMPENYQRAAQLVTPAPRQKRASHPKVPIQDDTVYEMPPAHWRAGDEPLTSRRRHRTTGKVHWLLIFGIGMIVMLALWGSLSALISWWNVTQDDWHYGRPRTFQIDAVVGHNNDSLTTPSHFIAINLNRHIEMIEFPAGDASKARMFIGPTLYGDGQDLTPITISFKDVNGDGKPDMIIQFADTRIVFINENGTFRPLKQGEHVNL